MRDDRRLAFVMLAAIGAYFLAYGIASGIGLQVWTSGWLGTPSGPPRLEPTLAVGTFAGGFVGWRLGRWRGVLAFAVVGIIGALRHLTPVIQCAAGDTAICEAMKDLDFVIPQLWLVPGLVVGVIAANLVRVEIPLRTELAALGVFALTLPLRFVVSSLPIYFTGFRGPDGRYPHNELLSIDVALVVAGALLAAVFLLRRSTRPRRSGLLLAAVFVALGLLRLLYMVRYAPGRESLELINQLSDFLAAAVILVVTAFSRSSRSTLSHGRWPLLEQERNR